MPHAVLVTTTKSHQTAPIDVTSVVALVSRFVIAAALVVAAVRVTSSVATFLLGWTLVSVAVALVLTTLMGDSHDEAEFDFGG